MTTNDRIARARTLPTGAVFYRCALQANPHHYGGTFRGKDASGDATTHALAIVDKPDSLGMEGQVLRKAT